MFQLFAVWRHTQLFPPLVLDKVKDFVSGICCFDMGNFARQMFSNDEVATVSVSQALTQEREMTRRK